MEPNRVRVSQCFERETTFGPFDEPVHFATRVVTVVENRHVSRPSDLGNLQSRYSNISSLLLEKYC